MLSIFFNMFFKFSAHRPKSVFRKTHGRVKSQKCQSEWDGVEIIGAPKNLSIWAFSGRLYTTILKFSVFFLCSSYFCSNCCADYSTAMNEESCIGQCPPTCLIKFQHRRFLLLKIYVGLKVTETLNRNLNDDIFSPSFSKFSTKLKDDFYPETWYEFVGNRMSF